LSRSDEKRLEDIRWTRWLLVVLWALFGYALVLVVAGPVAGRLFAAFGFGPDGPADTAEVREYLNLPYMVLGAVLAGWSSMMISVVRGPLRDGSPWAVPALIRSLALWFVLDTGMSVVLGHPTHALFNLPIAVALALPLARLRSH
jgi:hypothetical protein